jgi:hypothetical protein
MLEPFLWRTEPTLQAGRLPPLQEHTNTGWRIIKDIDLHSCTVTETTEMSKERGWSLKQICDRPNV